MMQSFRDTVAHLEAQGEVQRIFRTVDPHHELSAVMTVLDREKVVYFERVAGYDMPVVGNLLGSRVRIARLLDVDPLDLERRLEEAIGQPVAPQMVKEAPCQEIVCAEQVNVLEQLPVPTFFEREQGPYITAGVVVAKHPITGKRNISINRFQVLGPDRLMIGMAPTHHLHQLLNKAQELGHPLEIAVSIGNHPAVLLASNYYVELGHDEYDIAGNLLGEPLRIAKGVTVDVEAPAEAEVVLEGTISRDELVEEGTVSEFHGLYENYGKSPVFTVQAITHRAGAIFQVINPGYHAEHLLIGALCIGATTLHAVKRAVSGARNVVIPLGGGGRLHATIALHQPSAGEAKKALFAAFAHCNLLKHVMVVEDDIDITDPQQVEWAMATRMRGDRDIVIIPGVKADRAEPLEEELTVSKVGIVALRQPTGSRQDFTPARVPDGVMECVRREWSTYIDKDTPL
jgi:2,5-furandicarboxylate decarboxylase 1